MGTHSVFSKLGDNGKRPSKCFSVLLNDLL